MMHQKEPINFWCFITTVSKLVSGNFKIDFAHSIKDIPTLTLDQESIYPLSYSFSSFVS